MLRLTLLLVLTTATVSANFHHSSHTPAAYFDTVAGISRPPAGAGSHLGLTSASDHHHPATEAPPAADYSDHDALTAPSYVATKASPGDIGQNLQTPYVSDYFGSDSLPETTFSGAETPSAYPPLDPPSAPGSLSAPSGPFDPALEPPSGSGFAGLEPSYSGSSGPVGGAELAPGPALAGGLGPLLAGVVCRPHTLYELTWTSLTLPVTVYSTRTERLPTTLYRYVTESLPLLVTQVVLQTTERRIPPGSIQETRVGYTTRTVLTPRVKQLTSTLVVTDDRHVTVTETDHLTRTLVRTYPLPVVDTVVSALPEVTTSLVTEFQTQVSTYLATVPYDVVLTSTLAVPLVQLVTHTVTNTERTTLSVTHTVQQRHTVTACPPPAYSELYY